ncbi:glucose 1-dehydrogenase [Myxococcota bacterium]|nr:glucose 1-dehydrogenase [Myxococcota bacterium]
MSETSDAKPANRLAGKVALVTGGARGIGEAVVRVFTAEGARVLFGDLRDELGERVAKDIGCDAAYLHHDVREEESWRQFVDAAAERFGRIDALVNNAGIIHISPLIDTSLGDYLDVVNTNQLGCFLGMRSVAPVMAKAGRGSIVNISSTQGLEGAAGLSAYVASKFAVTGMTQTAALELGPQGIRVNSIHPGGIDTEMGDGDMEGFEEIDSEAFFASTPAGRMGAPEEVARMALYLASDESDYVRGAAFRVDGGIMAGERY